jgi:hypothetical protein
MNGFEADIVSILKHNNMLHSESRGLVLHEEEFVYKLWEQYKVVASFEIGSLTKYDYIVLDGKVLTVPRLVEALSLLSENGLLVLEVTIEEGKFSKRYLSKFANFTATKVKYEERVYMIIHQGVDYGN